MDRYPLEARNRPGRHSRASFAMTDDTQLTPVPDSFLAIWSGARGRLLVPAEHVRARYDLCEDLATHLQSSAQALHHDDGLSEFDVLSRMQTGLASPEAGLSADEAHWIAWRLAEIMRWQDAAEGLTLPASSARP
jgi:hypothetical protein